MPPCAPLPTGLAPAWHTRYMSVLRTIFGGLAEGMAPDGTMLRQRVRINVDALLTLLISILAVVLTVGYQVVRHMPESWRTSLRGDSPTED